MSCIICMLCQLYMHVTHYRRKRNVTGWECFTFRVHHLYVTSDTYTCSYTLYTLCIHPPVCNVRVLWLVLQLRDKLNVTSPRKTYTGGGLVSYNSIPVRRFLFLGSNFLYDHTNFLKERCSRTILYVFCAHALAHVDSIDTSHIIRRCKQKTVSYIFFILGFVHTCRCLHHSRKGVYLTSTFPSGCYYVVYVIVHQQLIRVLYTYNVHIPGIPLQRCKSRLVTFKTCVWCSATYLYNLTLTLCGVVCYYPQRAQ